MSSSSTTACGVRVRLRTRRGAPAHFGEGEANTCFELSLPTGHGGGGQRREAPLGRMLENKLDLCAAYVREPHLIRLNFPSDSADGAWQPNTVPLPLSSDDSWRVRCRGS
jgi:hypothetical protein